MLIFCRQRHQWCICVHYEGYDCDPHGKLRSCWVIGMLIFSLGTSKNGNS